MKSDRKFIAVQALPHIPPAAVPALVSALAAIFLYAITLFGTFVYDDIAIVREDPRVRQPSHWRELWTKDYFDGGVDNLYRPIVSSSYALEWFLHGNRPWIFHAVNILLHALACAAVAEFTRRSLGTWPRAPAAATCAGLLFAVHPVHVEAVANIVGRAELACTATIFAALVILCRRPLTNGRMTKAIVCAVIALLCKEQGIVQPLIWLFFGYLIWRFQQSRGVPPRSGPARPGSVQELHAVKLLVLIICWTWAIYIIGREHFLKFEWDRSFMDVTIQPMVKSFGVDRVLMPIVLLGHYTALLLWPAHLSPDYGADVIGSVAHLADPYLWIGFTAVSVWLAASIWAWVTARRVILFCLLSLAATYGIIGNILTLIGTIFAERLLYLPSAFFLIIIAILLAHLPNKPRLIALILLLTLGSIRTFTAARLWNHPMELYQTALVNQPKSLQLRLLIAQEYHAANDEPAAAAILADACRIYPDSWKAWMHRAEQAMDAGRLDDAEKYLAHARKLEANTNLLGPQERLAEMRPGQNQKPETRK